MDKFIEALNAQTRRATGNRTKAWMVAMFISLPIAATASNEADPELVNAISREDCAKVEDRLNAGASANGRFEDGYRLISVPVIFMATTTGNECVIAALARHGADVNAVIPNDAEPDKPLMSPLTAAITMGNIEAVTALLAAGANTALIDEHGRDLVPLYVDGLNRWIEPKRSPGTIAQITKLLEQAEKN